LLNKCLALKLNNIVKVRLIVYTAIICALSLYNCSKSKIGITPTAPVAESKIGLDFNLLEDKNSLDTKLYLEGGILKDQDSNFFFKNRTWQGTPSIGMDRNKNLFVGWISGGEGEGTENYITVSLSKDNGATWLHNKLVVYVNTLDSTRLMDVCFFNDKFGNLYMVWAKHVQKKNSKEWAIVWYSKLTLRGNTINYTAPRPIAEGSMLNKPYYSEKRNKLYFPIAYWFWGNASIYEGQYDPLNTKNLLAFKNVGYLPIQKSISNIHEHMLVELSDNTFLGMVRTTDGIYYSRSKDASIWDSPSKFMGIGPTAVSRFCLRKLKSGRLILIANNNVIRRDLRIFLSEDDGKTWPYSLMLDSRWWSTYPDFEEDVNGELKIVYDFERKPTGTIYYATIKEADIIAGKSSNLKKTIVNTLR